MLLKLSSSKLLPEFWSSPVFLFPEQLDAVGISRCSVSITKIFPEPWVGAACCTLPFFHVSLPHTLIHNVHILLTLQKHCRKAQLNPVSCVAVVVPLVTIRGQASSTEDVKSHSTQFVYMYCTSVGTRAKPKNVVFCFLKCIFPHVVVASLRVCVCE